MTKELAKRLVRSLQDPAVYDHASKGVELIETHMSWVFLTGPYAYKIKKPVDLGFADFSTLQKRRFFCQEELRVNRRLAPQLYLDVVPITGTPDAPVLDGPDEPIEFAVKMQQFSQGALLSNVLEQGRLLPAHVDGLAREVAEFHGRIDVDIDENRFGNPQSIRQPMEENFRELCDAIDDRALSARLEELKDWSEREFAARVADFRARKKAGFVRECHGDMHLGNMILHDGVVRLFDGIEFNENFRWIDVISEVAFLVMDLEDRGRADLAHRFLNGYLEFTGDYEGLAVLPYYLTYRALVRAKVDRIRLRQKNPREDERQELRDESYGYIELAERYARPPHPRLMITHGVSGSGKTSGTQQLVDAQGVIRVRSDVERKRLFGLDPLSHSDSALGADLYSAEATRRTYARLADLAAAVVRAGFSVVVDATFLKRTQRTAFQQKATELGVPFLMLDFRASEETLRERITQRERQGKDASEADHQVLTRQLKSQQPLGPEERSSVIAIDSEEPGAAESLVAAVERR